MKTIGLLGGMSWESTVSYYQTINRLVGERLGGLHSARIVLYSVDFQGIEELQRAGRWDEAGAVPAEAAAALERGVRTSSSCAPTRCTSWPPRSRPAWGFSFSTSPTPRAARSAKRVFVAWGFWAPPSPWSRSSTGGDSNPNLA
jgi:aspartate racemase